MELPTPCPHEPRWGARRLAVAEVELRREFPNVSSHAVHEAIEIVHESFDRARILDSCRCWLPATFGSESVTKGRSRPSANRTASRGGGDPG
jgi:hypothetical protein